MSFHLPDLILESVIRDGLEVLKQEPTILDGVFKSLTDDELLAKYGSAELSKIKQYIQNRDIAVVHSFNEASAKSPCYSIQLGNEPEEKAQARLGDFDEDLCEDITDQDELDNLVRVDPVTITGYDPQTGQVSVDDSTDLETVYTNMILVDGDDNEFALKPGINNIDGQKSIFIEKNQTLNTSDPAIIKSQIDFKQFEINGITMKTDLLIGVHAQNSLVVKYLYTILKFIVQSRKKSLERRGLFNILMTGSDFTRDLAYKGDIVYNRFCTISANYIDDYKDFEITPIDSVEIDGTPVD